jgi:hypothetical protein
MKFPPIVYKSRSTLLDFLAGGLFVGTFLAILFYEATK